MINEHRSIDPPIRVPGEWNVAETARIAAFIRDGRDWEGMRIPHPTLSLAIQLFDGERLTVAVDLADQPKPANQGRGAIDISYQSGPDDTHIRLSEHSRDDEKLLPFFTALVRNLGDARDERAAARAVRNTLESWRRAFAEKPPTLSKAELIGLAGELTVLEYLVDTVKRNGPAEVVSWWRGPAGADHDFSIPGYFDLEVKATNPTSARLQISNEFQLEAGALPLYLLHVGIQEARPSASNAKQLSGEIRRLSTKFDAAGLAEFEAQLHAINIDEQSPELLDFYFISSGVDWYAIEPGVPRITSGELPPGVRNVRYEISIEQLARHGRRPLDILEGL
ncbi:PD-(D/E)XK motif protein [Gulosibacter macacae]|uniref:PD-(D/E)XK motif protein n=1 Tax=Gulosibacter macacae TaxID=2488791 RepID=A0A3P3VX72_9MICO|nr:PD-(D/E)XK motif protein [Gulosibacter macacae]RRJ86648.1 PD-(D/E)XK motif protein [Gulosibacter macacae]